MNKWKRAISAVAAVLVIGSAFAGCDRKTADDGFIEVTWQSSNGHARTFQEKMVEEFNDTIGKEKKIKISYSFKDDGSDVAVTLAAGGKAPDFIGGNLVEFVDKGYIEAIDDMPGGEEYLKNYEGYFREKTNMYKGKHYCVPTASQLYGLVYNKDMFKEAGIVDENGEALPPETWDEVREYAKKLTNKSEKKFGIILPLKWDGWFSYEVMSTAMAATGKFNGYDPATGIFDYTCMQPMLDNLIGMKNDGSIYPGATNIDNDPARARFAEGNIGMKFAVSWDVAVFNDQFPAKCDWGVAPLPSIEKDVKYMQSGGYTYSSYINKMNLDSDEKREAVMTVYKWMTSDEYCKKAYEAGVSLPWNGNIVGDKKYTGKIKGWADFNDILKISQMPPYTPERDTSAYTSIDRDFIDNCWTTGKKTTKQVLEDWSKAVNEGVKLFAESHPDVNLEDYIDKDYTAVR